MLSDVIGTWATAHQLDAVLWTSLGPKWGKEEGRIPSVEEVLKFVRQQGPDSKCTEYIRKAPEQVATEYRRRLAAEIDWLKPQAG